MEVEDFKSKLTEEDLNYEVKLIKTPDVSLWLEYIENMKSSASTSNKSKQDLIFIHLRSLRAFPTEIKLWTSYIQTRLELIKEAGNYDNIAEIGSILNIYSKATLSTSLDLDFLKQYSFFIFQNVENIPIDQIDRHYSKMLTLLPNINHWIVWSNYLKCLSNIKYKEQDAEDKTAITILERYWQWICKIVAFDVQLDYPIWDLEFTFERISKLIKNKSQLDKLEDKFNHIISQTTSANLYNLYMLRWRAYIRIYSNPSSKQLDKISSQFDQMMTQFNDQKVQLCKIYALDVLSKINFDQMVKFYYLQLSEVSNMKDFGGIFQNFTSIVEAHVGELIESRDPKALYWLEELEKLLKSRDTLANDLKLRINKNKIKFWFERISIAPDQEAKLEVYSQAIITIDINSVSSNETMSFAKLWANYAMEYFNLKDWETCSNLFEIASNMSWKDTHSKEFILIKYTNAIIDFNKSILKGVEFLKGVLEPTQLNSDDDSIHKSIKLWSYYIDLVESLEGSVNECVRLYEKCIQLKIISGVMILNYCQFLISKNMLRKSFSVYERGIELFSGDTKWIIMGVYLNEVLLHAKPLGKFSDQECRSIFENCIEDEFDDQRRFDLSMIYIKWELKYGSKAKVISILQKIIQNTDSQLMKIDCFKMIVGLNNEKGLKSVETTLVQAINSLSCNTPGFIAEIAATLVKVEVSLKDIAKARQVLKYTCESVMKFGKTVNLRLQAWNLWKQFELENGNEQTYKVMLQTKRILESQNKAENQLQNENNATTSQDQDSGSGVGFVISSKGPRIDTQDLDVVNDDAIDLEMDDFE